jgi:hypothetical protein
MDITQRMQELDLPPARMLNAKDRSRLLQLYKGLRSRGMGAKKAMQYARDGVRWERKCAGEKALSALLEPEK